MTHPISPNDFGKILVEQCRKITISEVLVEYKGQLKQAIIRSAIAAGGFDIKLATSRTRFGGERYWFVCPICQRRAGTIYMHPISELVGCRHCLGLNYRKRRYKGMVENQI